MSAGYGSEIKSVSVPAGSDLSAKQYYLVKVNTSGQLAVCGTRGERAHGVLLDDPAASARAGLLGYNGVIQVECGATFEEGDPITTDGSGKAIKASRAGDVVVGSALEPGASGARASVIIGVAGGATGQPVKIIVEDFENDYDAADDPAALQVDGTAASGTEDEVNVLHLKSSDWAYSAIGTQTITVPVVVTDGVNSLSALNIGMDQTDDDGVNIWTHGWPASGRPFVVGSDAAFYAQLKFSIADVSGTDDFHFGFRSFGVPAAAVDTYANRVGMMVSNTTLNIQTEIGAALVTTDTTDAMADATRTYTFKVLVSAAGVVTYQHDVATEGTLAAPTATAAVTLTDGMAVTPFIYFINAANLAGEVALYKFEAGYQ